MRLCWSAIRIISRHPRNRSRLVPSHRASPGTPTLSYTVVSSPQVAVDQGNRKSDDVEVAAFNFLDILRSQSLDRISTGLVHRLSACHVSRDLLFAHGQKPYRGHGPIPHQFHAALDTNARKDLVPPAGKLCEHTACISRIHGLAEYFSVDHNRGVGPQNHVARTAVDGKHLHLRQPLDV